VSIFPTAMSPLGGLCERGWLPALPSPASAGMGSALLGKRLGQRGTVLANHCDCAHCVVRLGTVALARYAHYLRWRGTEWYALQLTD
jgi:hypothetical protein